MSYDVEKVNPYHNGESKKEQVSHMFDEIAPHYDELNDALSLGVDRYWRFVAINELKKDHPKTILDIATGTGDFALLAYRKIKPLKIVGIDISEGMLRVAAQKVEKKNLSHIISFDKQDCSSMSFADNTFDAAMVAFGVRNFEDIDASFQEVVRVLKPGGKFIFLELTTPQRTPVKQLYSVYEKTVMPFIRRVLAADKTAYEYLPQSIKVFPQGREMMLILKANGFENIRLRRLTGGICSLYIAEKAL